MDMPQEELNYEYDSTTNSYYPTQNWGLAINTTNTSHVDSRRNVTPVQTSLHGLREPMMADQTIMGVWHYQDVEQQQAQQQQRQQQQHHHHQLQPHDPHIYDHLQQQQVMQQIQYQPQPDMGQHIHQHQHQTTSYLPQQTIDPAYSDMFHAIPMPTQMNMLAVTQPAMSMPLPIDQSYVPMQNSMDGVHSGWADLHAHLIHYQTTDLGPYTTSSYQQIINSPTGSQLEILSQPSTSDDSLWVHVDGRASLESSERSFFIDPNVTIHNRTISESSYSDLDQASHTGFLSNLDMGPAQAVYSPTTLSSDSEFEYPHSYHSHQSSEDYGVRNTAAVGAGTIVRAIPIPSSKGSSPIRSPGSQGSSGSPSRKMVKKNPIVIKGTERVTKKISSGGRHDNEKRVGKRKGPLKPEQRKQASEIRKLRACLRCKFLKKTCDKGEPCAGCQPSHARLWQVPCTRIDIKEIGYFLKGQRFDFERHLSLGFSVGNIKGFSDEEKTLFITHGYGHTLPVKAREVYIRDDQCMKMDWIEANKGTTGYEVSTAKFSSGSEGISVTLLSDYLDKHIDTPGTFESFVDEYFAGTPFLSQMLKSAYRFHAKTHSKIIKKALKLVLAYCLTLHITMIAHVPEEKSLDGRIEEAESMFYGKHMAPVMINFQIKCTMADMWRDLHKEVLEELSSLYSSVYSGDKLKNWPTIFILASVLLAVWECMQFDCHYRVPDEVVVDKFCTDMETTPVGVIVGLFSAISQKLPSILEWNTSKHHALLGSNWDVCDTMTEISEHVAKHEIYLRDRPNAKFDSRDFDSLSNKFLSRLVLRDVRAN